MKETITVKELRKRLKAININVITDSTNKVYGPWSGK